jgi:hypothetical protein
MREADMCLRDLLNLLRERGLAVTEPKLRWALKTGKLSRLPVDGSLRFDFGEQHLREALAYFSGKAKAPADRNEAE